MKPNPDFVIDDLGRLCHAPQPFNENDDDLMHDVCEGPTLAKPVQALLLSLREIKTAAGSFGVDKAKAFDNLLPELEALRAACKKLWEDQ
jgi:hypothetical protein